METLWKSWSGNRVWTVHHLETPGRSWKSIEESRSTKKVRKTETSQDVTKQITARACKGTEKQPGFPNACPWFYDQNHPDISRQVALEPLGKPPENNQEKRWVARGSNNVTQPFFYCQPNSLTQPPQTAAQIISPSSLKLPPTWSHQATWNWHPNSLTQAFKTVTQNILNQPSSVSQWLNQ